MSAKKKVIFCTYSSIYSSKILEQLIADCDVDLVAVINSTRVLKPSYNHFQGAISQLRTSGLRYSTYLFLISDFFKWIQPVFKLKRWPLRDIHSLAKLNNIPLIDTKDINSIETTNFIAELKPEFLLCAHFNQLLKENILGLEDIRCINIHPSLLPKYKGVDPVFFAMKDDVEEIGVSLHKIDEDFDSGEIYLQTSIKADKSKSLLFNNCQLFEEGIKLALQWIKNDHGESQTVVKNHNGGTYDSWPKSSDIKMFKRSGKRLMNLSGLWKQQ